MGTITSICAVTLSDSFTGMFWVAVPSAWSCLQNRWVLVPAGMEELFCLPRSVFLAAPAIPLPAKAREGLWLHWEHNLWDGCGLTMCLIP